MLQLRQQFQCTMRDDLVKGIETIVGRKVVAFMSDNYVDPDMAVEVFVVERPTPTTRLSQAGPNRAAKLVASRARCFQKQGEERKQSDGSAPERGSEVATSEVAARTSGVQFREAASSG